jgi:hypothetical protein
MTQPASVDSKPLAARLSPLDATLIQNRGWGPELTRERCAVRRLAAAFLSPTGHGTRLAPIPSAPVDSSQTRAASRPATMTARSSFPARRTISPAR